MSRAEKEEGQYMIRTIERAKTHYDVFQLPDDADAKTIRTTMRDMLRKIHPDKCGAAGLEATKRVNEAYDVLKDPDARAAYDLELNAQDEPPKPKAKPKAKPAAKPKKAAPATSSAAGSGRATLAPRPASPPTPRTCVSAPLRRTRISGTAAPSAVPCPGSRRRRLRERHRLGERRRRRAAAAPPGPTPSMCQTAMRTTTTTNERI